MHILTVGMNHRTAPLEFREKFAISPEQHGSVLEEITDSGGILEAVVLSTCNRMEIYAVAPHPRKALEIIRNFFKARGCSSSGLPPMASSLAKGEALAQADAPESAFLGEEFYIHEYPVSVRHLYEVASGLDSMVVGETEILGQVKKSYQLAHDAQRTGAILNRLFQTAFSAAKEVRSRTRIGEGSVSVGSVAVDLAGQIFGDLKDCAVLLVGAGEMGEITARSLRSRGAGSLVVANRSNERATVLSEKLGGRSIPWADLYSACGEVHVVITSTSSEMPVITQERLKPVIEKRKGRPLFLIDIAVPRDVERKVGQMDGVYLYDMDDLQVIADQNLAMRQGEMAAGRQIIREHEDRFIAWFGRRLLSLNSTTSNFGASSPALPSC